MKIYIKCLISTSPWQRRLQWRPRTLCPGCLLWLSRFLWSSPQTRIWELFDIRVKQTSSGIKVLLSFSVLRVVWWDRPWWNRSFSADLLSIIFSQKRSFFGKRILQTFSEWKPGCHWHRSPPKLHSPTSTHNTPPEPGCNRWFHRFKTRNKPWMHLLLRFQTHILDNQTNLAHPPPRSISTAIQQRGSERNFWENAMFKLRNLRNPPLSGPGSRHPCKPVGLCHRQGCLCIALERLLVDPSGYPQCFLPVKMYIIALKVAIAAATWTKGTQIYTRSKMWRQRKKIGMMIG